MKITFFNEQFYQKRIVEAGHRVLRISSRPERRVADPRVFSNQRD
jgi:hypothetical protein